MRKRRVLAIVVLAAIMSISMAVPAEAAARTRVYKGETSQAKAISFRIKKTDRGRSLKGFRVEITMTCEDATTQEWGLGWGFGGEGILLTDGVLVDFDDVFILDATHLHGRIGQHQGSGTFMYTIAALTADEQAQTCTTGDLTWQVEYDHTLSRTASTTWSPDLDGVMKFRIGPDGEASTTVRSLG